jgi:hypothetical protein
MMARRALSVSVVALVVTRISASASVAPQPEAWGTTAEGRGRSRDTAQLMMNGVGSDLVNNAHRRDRHTTSATVATSTIATPFRVLAEHISLGGTPSPDTMTVAWHTDGPVGAAEVSERVCVCVFVF